MVARKVPLQRMGQLADGLAGKKTDPPPLKPNQVQLYSYYKPGLQAGNYSILAEQNITSGSKTAPHGVEHLRVYNRKNVDPASKATPELLPQDFEVIAPQFSLDPKMVDSFYPPEGDQDEGRVLPHLVLNDPHFPWERRADALIDPLWDPDMNKGKEYLNSDIPQKIVSKDKAVMRNAVPWVALMVFDPDELAPLEPQDIVKVDPKDLPTRALNLPTIDLKKQPSTGAIPMTVQQYFGIPAQNRVNFEAGLKDDKGSAATLTSLKASKEMTNVIFPTKAKFLELFPNIPSLRYASHVRNINTTGFPEAGIDQMGLYSIIVSNRTGKYQTNDPVTQIVHLVSVEHLETTKAMLDKGDGRIGLISLFSWTYTALPPDPVNFVDSITNVINGMQTLRPKNGTLVDLKTKADKLEGTTASGLLALHKRLSAGYTLARWRCETGEETVAFSRGPLVPQRVPVHSADWATSSNTSKEYQILDKNTGIMDLSYSSAWQLGKILAISDTTFSGALSRLRSTIQRESQSKTRAELNSVSSRSSLIQAMKSDIKTVEQLASGDVSEPRRITSPAENTLAPSLDAPEVVPVFDKNVKDAILSAGSAGTDIYNGFNAKGHNNTDWTIVHTWISDKLFLSDIPAHVLIPDPTFLPMESIRFFNIDDTWLDCMIDGALSVGNHLERDDDRIRQGIKQTYNKYLKDDSLGIQPQIPSYGFFLRSRIVKVMPDLKITIDWKVGETPDARFSFCRYTRPDDHTILCLLDRPPEELNKIELCQPAHQQRFSFGRDYDPIAESFKFSLRQLYTDGTPAKDWAAIDLLKQPLSPKIKEWFAHSEKPINGVTQPPRVLDLTTMARDVNIMIQENSVIEKPYMDFVANSAELALELNDPSYYFWILPPTPDKNETEPPKSKRNRQLHCAAVIPPIDSSITTLNPKPADSKPIGGAGLPPKTADLTAPIRPVVRQSPNNATHIVVVKKDPIPVNPSQPLKTGIPLACFDVRIFADYKGLSPNWKAVDGSYDSADYIPTQNEYLYDLIFSVRKLPTRSKADYSLREIIINIPTNAIKAPAEPLINSGSTGPKVRMLSNQRFVPFLNWTDEYLQVRLVPRSAKEHPVMKINDNRSREISFRLQEVDVPAVRTPVWVPIHGGKREQLGLVKVLVYERYETTVGVVSATPAPGNVFVVKRDVQDKVIYK